MNRAFAAIDACSASASSVQRAASSNRSAAQSSSTRGANAADHPAPSRAGASRADPPTMNGRPEPPMPHRRRSRSRARIRRSTCNSLLRTNSLRATRARRLGQIAHAGL